MRSSQCLYCSAPMPRLCEVAGTCTSCGAINLKEDLRIFRTKRAWPVFIERTLKGITAGLLAAVTAVILLTQHRHGGGIAIGFPILLAVLLWDTIGLVTRRRSVFRMEVLWPAMIAGIGLGPMLTLMALDLGIHAGIGFNAQGPVFVWAAIWTGLGSLIWWLVKRRRNKLLKVNSGPSLVPSGDVPE